MKRTHKEIDDQPQMKTESGPRRDTLAAPHVPVPTALRWQCSNGHFLGRYDEQPVCSTCEDARRRYSVSGGR